MNNKEIAIVLSGILDKIDETNSDIEYGYCWKQSFLKDSDISDKAKKELGMWSFKDELINEASE